MLQLMLPGKSQERARMVWRPNKVRVLRFDGVNECLNLLWVAALEIMFVNGLSKSLGTSYSIRSRGRSRTTNSDSKTCC